jgi:hypothetical protein
MAWMKIMFKSIKKFFFPSDNDKEEFYFKEETSIKINEKPSEVQQPVEEEKSEKTLTPQELVDFFLKEKSNIIFCDRWNVKDDIIYNCFINNYKLLKNDSVVSEFFLDYLDEKLEENPFCYIPDFRGESGFKENAEFKSLKRDSILECMKNNKIPGFKHILYDFINQFYKEYEDDQVFLRSLISYAEKFILSDPYSYKNLDEEIASIKSIQKAFLEGSVVLLLKKPYNVNEFYERFHYLPKPVLDRIRSDYENRLYSKWIETLTEKSKD